MAIDEYIGINSDHDIVQPVFEEFTGLEIDDATVTAQLKEETVAGAAGANIGSAVTCTYQSDGIYKGVLPASVTATLTWRAKYSIWVTIVHGGVTIDTREIECRAVHRGRS